MTMTSSRKYKQQLDLGVDVLHQDIAVAETEIAQSHRGQPPMKRVKRVTIQLQERLQKICRDRDETKVSRRSAEGAQRSRGEINKLLKNHG